ncbi:MAG: cyclopropane-fatty-acyl-phospholipid synthase family protein [Vicinamibacterales bacterium]
MNRVSRWAKTAFLSGLDGLRGGRLTLVCPGQTYRFGVAGDLDATLTVRDERFFLRALTGSDIGIGESFMDGDWTTPDVVPLGRLMLRNRRILDSQNRVVGAFRRLSGGLLRRLRDNSIAGSRRHIHRHYDLGNDFFRLFLDTELLMYSCGHFESVTDSLERSQMQKVDQVCRKLALTSSDHVLEIGSGWGGFAVWAATRYGCRVTTTTISDQQYRHVNEWRSRLGEVGARIEVRRADYRELTGQFDKIVSLEMFEAVGLRHYDEYFAAVDRLLVPDGSMLLQTITVDDQWFPHYHGTPDWIEKYIFPGGELASVGEIVKSLARTTTLSVYHAENWGTHYARTLREWRARFHQQLDGVRALGFDDRFIRMWDLYLASCESAFLERHAGVFQILLLKNGAQQVLFNEPWSETVGAPGAVVSRQSVA